MLSININATAAWETFDFSSPHRTHCIHVAPFVFPFFSLPFLYFFLDMVDRVKFSRHDTTRQDETVYVYQTVALLIG